MHRAADRIADGAGNAVLVAVHIDERGKNQRYRQQEQQGKRDPVFLSRLRSSFPHRIHC
jgi:hypothetical protein